MLQTLTLNLKNHVQSPKMFLGFISCAFFLGLIFLLNYVFSEIKSGTAWSMMYGVFAAMLMLAATFFGIRRRLMNPGWGRSQTWLQCHIYGGGLFLLFVLMHSGFREPTGMITWWLWALSIWVTASGILGTILQKWIPKVLSSGLSIEVIYERIPELIAEIRQKAEALIRECETPLQDFYRQHIAEALAGPNSRIIYFFDITGGIQTRARQFSYLRDLLDDKEKENLDLLENYYKTKLEMDAHYTLQKALRWWLFLHAPLSLVLLVLLGFHLYSVFWY